MQSVQEDPQQKIWILTITITTTDETQILLQILKSKQESFLREPSCARLVSVPHFTKKLLSRKDLLGLFSKRNRGRRGFSRLVCPQRWFYFCKEMGSAFACYDDKLLPWCMHIHGEISWSKPNRCQMTKKLKRLLIRCLTPAQRKVYSDTASERLASNPVSKVSRSEPT